MSEALQDLVGAIERQITSDLMLASATVVALAEVVADTTEPTPSLIEVNAQRLKDGAFESDAELLSAIALHGPVAGDLRLITALMHIAHHQSLIANQFVLITAQLMETDPRVPVIEETAGKLVRMATLAGAQLTKATRALCDRSLDLAREVAGDDVAINLLNREVFATTVRTDGTLIERDVMMRQMLIGRSIERIADNAVDIAEHAAFLVTGELTEFTDASRPGQRRIAGVGGAPRT
ncbi:MAG: phosphate transport system protein [Solirubrobacteraceae bacterium]|jgi:phosphate transport system protein|nr:phosphate transport system protein [Solirubrobacteraceae bacterium]